MKLVLGYIEILHLFWESFATLLQKASSSVQF